MNLLLLVAPLVVLALVLVFGFAGCALPRRGTAPEPYTWEVWKTLPAAWWRLSEQPGSAQAHDEIDASFGGPHPGTYVSPVVLGNTPGLVPTEPSVSNAHFDGNGSVQVPPATIFAATSFSVEALVRPDKIGDGVNSIVVNMSPAGGWALRITPSTDPGADADLLAEGSDGAGLGGPTIPLVLAELVSSDDQPWKRAWHVVMTHDDNTGITRLYKDGVHLGTGGPGTFPYTPNMTFPLQIGVAFAGGIQDVAFYGYVLTAQHVADHHQATQVA
jgi:hypothetical protein